MLAYSAMRRALLLFFGWLALAGAGFAQSAEPNPAQGDPTSPKDRSIGGTDYVATRGLRLGGTGLTIGAFSTLELDKESGRPGTVALDSVNPLVLWEPFDFVRAFAELEIGQLFTWEPSTGDVSSTPDLTFERLYGEVSGGDAVNVRFGKFQTPVGIWNLVPAEPFTWTATNPVIVDAAFDEHQTGGALFGSLYPGGSTLEYCVYGQFVDPLHPDEEAVDRSVGGRLRVSGARDDWAVGASFLASGKDGRWNKLGGVDAFWGRGPVELQAEVAVVEGDIPGRNLQGGYVQAAYHLGAHFPRLRGLHLVARYELVLPEANEEASQIGNLGLTWIPKPFLNLKVGGQLVDEPTERTPRGVFGSVSVVF